MKKHKHLVTGGTGFIGSALVQKLVAESYPVRVLDNGLRGNTTNLSPVLEKIEIFEADIRDVEKVRLAVEGCETVWHLAAVNGTENFYKKPDLVLEVGVKGMLNVLEACRVGHVANLFTMSSSEVYQTPSRIPTDEKAPLTIPDPLNPRYSYGASKLISEMMTLHCARDTASRVVIVRPHNIYGPAMGWEHVVPQLVSRIFRLMKDGGKKIRVPIQGTGSETRAFCFVSDMVDAMMILYEKALHREIYHVGNAVETSIGDLVTEIGKALGVTSEIEPGPLTEGSTLRRCPDIKKINSLGYTAKVSLTEGIKKTTDWYLKELLLRERNVV